MGDTSVKNIPATIFIKILDKEIFVNKESSLKWIPASDKAP
jgi:hypothetical protein